MASGLEGFIVAPHEGMAWGMGPGRPAVFKILTDATDGRVGVFEEMVPPGVGTPLHIHRDSDEVIYILSGEFIARLGDRTHRISTGAWAFVPRTIVHGWRNCGTSEGRALFMFAPGGGAKSFEELCRQGKSLPEIDPAVRAEIFERNGHTVITRDWE
ncbi:cupin domain-containing protein [Dankookia rubra]|uniref:Cupin domain-containing protein n=1 Tax=Dankookia rubra TaxID=1442381 RepID=A0A4R5Q641_9PROT|nr:cupin domain-containing protein [Dankookia rubra]